MLYQLSYLSAAAGAVTKTNHSPLSCALSIRPLLQGIGPREVLTRAFVEGGRSRAGFETRSRGLIGSAGGGATPWIAFQAAEACKTRRIAAIPGDASDRLLKNRCCALPQMIDTRLPVH